MHTLAAILVNTSEPLVIDNIKIPALKTGQVLVEVKYSGVCHTQLLEARGHRGEDKFLPHCLGHEGSGIVVEIGKDVKKVKAGDRVILSWIKGSGENVMSTIYDWNGRNVNAGAITTFSKYAIISENRVTPIPNTFPMDEAALLGCALPTGLGSVFNTASPKPGQSLAVFGCGGVGLCAIAAANTAGCVPIIAVDILQSKLDLASKMGATHVINAKETDVVSEIQKICNLDYAIEATGSPIAMSQALKSIRPQGGTAVIVGNAKHGSQLSIDPSLLNQGKRILGTWGGDNDPDIHYPRYCNLLKYGKINVDPFIQKKYALESAEEALKDLESGAVLRPLIDMSL
ncbi:MAG: zinc-binding dehydrogenase [Chlamydiae bacterium]|nr:zinc-binding dehydrogenase [Chlamydiota bacterium]